jgi:hypothetical protein
LTIDEYTKLQAYVKYLLDLFGVDGTVEEKYFTQESFKNWEIDKNYRPNIFESKIKDPPAECDDEDYYDE